MHKPIVFNLNDFPLKYGVKLKGPLKEIQVSGTIDTGTDISIVSSHILCAIGIDSRREEISRVEMQLADGHMVMASRIKLKVIAEEKEIIIEPVVFENSLLPLILGMDFLRELGCDSLLAQQWIHQFSILYAHIRKVKNNCVLIVGNDSIKEGIQRLLRIRDKLKELDYEGILLKDYPDIEEQAIEEKMNLFGNLVKFVICENSFYSGHIDELSICARNRMVTIILQESGKYTTWMQACYPIDFNFIKKIEYTMATFNESVLKAVEIAETIVRERRRALNKEYKYREEWFKKSSKKG